MADSLRQLQEGFAAHIRDPDQVAVSGELQEGERVVVHPPDTVTDGADVEVLATAE